MDHAEIQELLGAYALDAVEPDEAAQIERHLAGCPQCAAEVASYREVAGLLGSAEGLAPPGLWDRIASGLEEQPPALRLDRYPAPPAAAAPDAAAVPAESKRGRSGDKTVSARVFTAVLAVAAVVLVGLGIQVARLSSRTSNLPSTVASQLMIKSYQAAAGQFDAKHVSLSEPGGSRSIPAVILPNGTAYVDARQLPSLSADRTYQMWGVSGSTTAPVSLAVMGSDPAVQQMQVPDAVNTLVVTVEPAGGVPAPTTPAVAQGQILS